MSAFSSGFKNRSRRSPREQHPAPSKKSSEALNTSALEKPRTAFGCFRTSSAELGIQDQLNDAVRENSQQRVKLLLEQGADVNASDEAGMTPLHLAAARGAKVIALYLLQRGAAVDETRRNDSRTPLHIAAKKGHVDVVMTLVHYGANMEARDHHGKTPLHHALRKKKKAAALGLIEKGAKLTSKDHDGRLPLYYVGKTSGGLRRMLETITRREEAEAQQTMDSHGQNEQPSKETVSPLQDVEQILIPASESSADIERVMEPAEGESMSLYFCVHNSARESLSTAQEPSETPKHGEDDHGIPSQASAKLELDMFPREQNGVDGQYSNSGPPDESDSSCSSTLDTDKSDSSERFGTKTKLIEALERLRFEEAFHEIYEPVSRHVPGRMQIRFAMQLSGQQELVVLKFYSLRSTFENAWSAHELLGSSPHVCRLLEAIEEDSKYPACLVLERGIHTLNDWLFSKNPEYIVRKWCLNEILKGVRDVHRSGLVHNDLKPSNIMFFGDDVTWKLIDLDEVQRNGEGPATRFSPSYAPPEMLEAVENGDECPASHPSMDMWSFGVIAYEVISGQRFYGGDVTAADALEFLKKGKAQQNLDRMTVETCRDILKHLLVTEPEKRWTAEMVLETSAFKWQAPPPV